MKNNPPFNSEEIDLITLFKLIFKEKIKILFITIATFLIGIGYSIFIQSNFSASLTISKIDNYKLYNLNYINQSLKNKKSLTNQEILDIFINEFKEKKLNENIRSLKIIRKGSDYILNFESDNIDEALKILEETINLTSNKLEKSIYKNLYARLNLKKNTTIDKDFLLVKYLEEQSRIAEELNISDIKTNDLITNYELNNNTPYNYYLMGYKAIDKEIELIQNRKYENFKLIEERIDLFKKEKIDWIKYNINSIEVKSLKYNKLILISSIFIGLSLGLLFVVILDQSRSKTLTKKRRL